MRSCGDQNSEPWIVSTWSRLLGSAVSMNSARPKATGFPARGVTCREHGRACHIIEAPSHTARRTLRDVRSFDPEQVHLNCILSGERQVRALGEEFVAGSGEIFALDTRRPFDLLETHGRYCGVKLVFAVPGRRAGRARNGLPSAAAIRAHPLFELLRTTCNCLGASLESGRPEVPTLVSVAKWLFRLMARGQSPECLAEARHEIFLMIGLEMERNLSDPAFTLERLARRLGVSSRYVQRVLARHRTTFVGLLREKRMQLAHGLLSESRHKIEWVAGDCGYSELSAFYRAFKRHFGYPPGAVRRPDALRAGD